MIRDRVLPVALAIVVIVLVAVLQDRSRYLAALLAVMPLTAPLAMWVVFSATGGDHRQTAEFTGSMVMGSVASLVFVLASWLALRQGWPFPIVVLFAGVIWLAVALVPGWARGLLR